jgi:DNA-directed RNA polymerase specialized sigma24 family protein
MMSQRSSNPRSQPRGRDVRLAGSVVVTRADGIVRLRTDPEPQASPISHRASGAEHLSDRWQTDTLTLLDRVDDRDRAVLAMLLERVHPDDIAATLGVSAATLKLRRNRIIARLRPPLKLPASMAGPDPAGVIVQRRIGNAG